MVELKKRNESCKTEVLDTKMKTVRLNEIFRKLAAKISLWVGTPQAFILAIIVVVTWVLTGPVFGFSDTWQLIINTGTTIITFLMVFLIQNTQNRETKAIHIKLDELLKGIKGARTSFVNIEELPDEVLDSIQEQFRKINERYFKELAATIKTKNKNSRKR